MNKALILVNQMHVFVRLSFFFVPLVTEKVVKSSKKNFDQQIAGGAPVCWSKYTTKVNLKQPLPWGQFHFRWAYFIEIVVCALHLRPNFMPQKASQKLGVILYDMLPNL